MFRVLGGPWRAGRGLQPARARSFESLWGKHQVGWIVFSLRSGREKRERKHRRESQRKEGQMREGSRKRSKMGGVQRQAKDRAGRGRSKELLRGRERDRCRERKKEGASGGKARELGGKGSREVKQTAESWAEGRAVPSRSSGSRRLNSLCRR